MTMPYNEQTKHHERAQFIDCPIADLSEHPVLADFPLLPAEQYAALKESIFKHGQLKPLVAIRNDLDGFLQVIDGRNRLRVMREMNCPRADVELLDWDVDPLTYAIESAVTGRNLTKSGVVLMLFLKHPDLAENRAEREKGVAPIDKINGSFKALAERYRVPPEYFTILAQIRDALDDADFDQVKGSILSGEASLPALKAGIGGLQATKAKRRADPEYSALITKASRTVVNAFKCWPKLKFLNQTHASTTVRTLTEMFEVMPDQVRSINAGVIVNKWPAHEQELLARDLVDRLRGYKKAAKKS
jgi:hypothetical protein